MQHIGAYFEIPVIDLERAIDFYSFIFSCNFTRDLIHGNEMAFFPFEENFAGITGALCKGEIYKPSTSGTLIYLATPNIDFTLQKVLEMKGEVLFPKTTVLNQGWVAEFKDSEGNRVGLYQMQSK